MILARRAFLGGLGALLAAPAIVRASSLMQIRPVPPESLVIDIYEDTSIYMIPPTDTPFLSVSPKLWKSVNHDWHLDQLIRKEEG